jgi:hypothetical protein
MLSTQIQNDRRTLKQQQNPFLSRKKMSLAVTTGEASLADVPPPKRTIRGAKFVQRCWWLLFPLIIAATTFVFLPPQWKPNLVRFFSRCAEKRSKDHSGIRNVEIPDSLSRMPVGCVTDLFPIGDWRRRRQRILG